MYVIFILSKTKSFRVYLRPWLTLPKGNLNNFL